MKRIIFSICIFVCLAAGASAQNFPDIPEAGTPDPRNGLIRSGILAPHRPTPRPPATNFWAHEPSPPSPDRKEWAIALLAGANNVKALLGKSKPHEGGWTLAQGATGRERLKIAIANLPDLKRGCATMEKEIASMKVDIEALKRELAGLLPILTEALNAPFDDVPGSHWAKVALVGLKDLKLIRGYPPQR